MPTSSNKKETRLKRSSNRPGSCSIGISSGLHAWLSLAAEYVDRHQFLCFDLLVDSHDLVCIVQQHTPVAGRLSSERTFYHSPSLLVLTRNSSHAFRFNVTNFRPGQVIEDSDHTCRKPDRLSAVQRRCGTSWTHRPDAGIHHRHDPTLRKWVCHRGSGSMHRKRCRERIICVQEPSSPVGFLGLAIHRSWLQGLRIDGVDCSGLSHE